MSSLDNQSRILRSNSKTPKGSKSTDKNDELTCQEHTKPPKGSESTDKNDELTCHECKSVNNFGDIGLTKQQAVFITTNAVIGVRWVCFTCRTEPDRIQTLANEVENFKASMKSSFEKMETTMKNEMKSMCQALKSDMKSHCKVTELDESARLRPNAGELKIPSYSRVVTKNQKENKKIYSDTVPNPKIFSESELEKDPSEVGSENVFEYTTVVAKNSKVNKKATSDITAKSKTVSEHELEKERKNLAQKRNNICIFNLPESSKDDPEEAYQDDITRLKPLFKDEIVLEKNVIQKIYRKGDEVNFEKPRPVIMKFSTYDKKQQMLELRNIKGKTETNEIFQISIEPDRTIKEQKEHKQLVLKLKKRRDQGEENIFIQNNRIIKVWPFQKDPQKYWG